MNQTFFMIDHLAVEKFSSSLISSAQGCRCYLLGRQSHSLGTEPEPNSACFFGAATAVVSAGACEFNAQS